MKLFFARLISSTSHGIIISEKPNRLRNFHSRYRLYVLTMCQVQSKSSSLANAMWIYFWIRIRLNCDWIIFALLIFASIGGREILAKLIRLNQYWPGCETHACLSHGRTIANFKSKLLNFNRKQIQWFSVIDSDFCIFHFHMSIINKLGNQISIAPSVDPQWNDKWKYLFYSQYKLSHERRDITMYSGE